MAHDLPEIVLLLDDFWSYHKSRRSYSSFAGRDAADYVSDCWRQGALLILLEGLVGRFQVLEVRLVVLMKRLSFVGTHFEFEIII